MADIIVKVPTNKTIDYDFIAFSFNGKHSYEDFGIYRVIDGDRYNVNLTPTLKDKTAENLGGDGLYYFGTSYDKKDIPVSFAFDGLSEAKLRQMKKWLNGDDIYPLWFSEEPYKVYMAKVTGQPTLKVIPFDENNTRIYKGEGNVTFTAFYPFAQTPDYVEYLGNKMSGNYYASYAHFSNYEQIKNVLPKSVELDPGTGLLEPTEAAFGDLPFFFKAKLMPPQKTTKIEIISEALGTNYNVTDANYSSDNGDYIIITE